MISFLRYGIWKGLIFSVILSIFWSKPFCVSGSFFKTEALELINMAEQEKLIDSKQCSSLHKLRKIRNGFQHPEKEQIQYTKADIEEWRDIVFEIGGSK